MKEEGLFTCEVEDQCQTQEGFFKSGLGEPLKSLRRGEKGSLRSGGHSVAVKSDRRKGPLDDDALRDCASEVASAHVTAAFVLVLDLCSDSRLVSWSGCS